jgi:hypothetical protein
LNSSAGMTPDTPQPTERAVVVTDIQMPFSSMVVFMTKWALAMIPVAFILLVIAMVFVTVFAGTGLTSSHLPH